MGFNSRVKRGIEERVVRKFGQPSSYFNTAQFMSNIDCKGLIIHDQNDPVIPYTDALEIQTAYKNSTLVTTNGPGCGLKKESSSSNTFFAFGGLKFCTFTSWNQLLPDSINS